MLTRIQIAFLVAVLALPAALTAQKGHASTTRSSSKSTSIKSKSSSAKRAKSSAKKPTSSVPKKSTLAKRASNGKIKRDAAPKKAFMKKSGYPKGRKGSVVDHIVPLECGGADVASNMQWETVSEAKIKDRTERNCRRE
jgi:5-methylcytosine-specific restriction endonuclease McrA